MSGITLTNESFKQTIKKTGKAIATSVFLIFLFLVFKAAAAGFIILASAIGYWFYLRLQVFKWGKDPEIKPILDAVRPELSEERSQTRQT